MEGCQTEFRRHPDIKVLSDNQNAKGSREGGLEVMTSLLESLHQVRVQAASSNRRALDSVARLSKLLPDDALALIVARLDGDIRDLAGLHALGPYLATSRGG